MCSAQLCSGDRILVVHIPIVRCTGRPTTNDDAVMGACSRCSVWRCVCVWLCFFCSRLWFCCFFFLFGVGFVVDLFPALGNVLRIVRGTPSSMRQWWNENESKCQSLNDVFNIFFYFTSLVCCFFFSSQFSSQLWLEEKHTAMERIYYE